MGGCGSSTGTSGVLSNSVTQNGRTHLLQPESATSLKHSGLSDLNINDPELQEAATRIQAVYRGHRTRNSLRMTQEEEVIDINLDDPEVASAATKIQASFRGHQARKQAQKDKDGGDAELSENLEKLKTNTADEAEEELPDLSDPELNKAATKIQASFRGHMVRKDKETDSQ